MNKNHPHSRSLLLLAIAAAAWVLSKMSGSDVSEQDVAAPPALPVSPAAPASSAALDVGRGGNVIVSFNVSAKARAKTEPVIYNISEPNLDKSHDNCRATQKTIGSMRGFELYDIESLVVYANYLSKLYSLSATLEDCSQNIRDGANALLDRSSSVEKVMKVAKSYGAEWVLVANNPSDSPDRKAEATKGIERLLAITKYIGQLTAGDDLEGGVNLARLVSHHIGDAPRDIPAPGR